MTPLGTDAFARLAGLAGLVVEEADVQRLQQSLARLSAGGHSPKRNTDVAPARVELPLNPRPWPQPSDAPASLLPARDAAGFVRVPPVRAGSAP